MNHAADGRPQQDLTTLLADGERHVFHGSPVPAIPVLEQALELARATGKPAEEAAVRWLLGVALTAAGRYGAAVGVLDPVAATLFASLAAATLASLNRQLARHAVAEEFDRRGLQLAGDHPEAVFDCRLGLAADAVGLGRLADARDALAVAEELAAGREDWWRQRIRLDWVRAEVALLADEPDAAAAAAARSVARAEQARAPRHVAKGLLFQGVAEDRTGATDPVGTLRRAAILADDLGTLPLVWPARGLLARLLADRDPAASAEHRRIGRDAVGVIAADLPLDVRTDWLARPDVAELAAP
jgi:hypothetical protein